MVGLHLLAIIFKQTITNLNKPKLPDCIFERAFVFLQLYNWEFSEFLLALDSLSLRKIKNFNNVYVVFG